MNEEKLSKLPDLERQIFVMIARNDVNGFRQLITQIKGSVDFVDSDGMTLLQHACCKGSKEVVQVLLDMGADITFNKHGADYTPLHFAALSGNPDVCRLILDAGINPNSLNSVFRTASQMAAFVGNHSCVETINNYVPRKTLEYYTQPHGQYREPLIPPTILEEFHKFIIEINLHPVRVALNLQALGLLQHLHGLKKVLEYMCEKEIQKSSDVNELMALKFHYLCWILGEVLRCKEQCKSQRPKENSADVDAAKHDFVELFIKRVLKENKVGQLEYLEFTLRECVREFPLRECTVFRRVVSELAAKDPNPALFVFRNAINGQRSFTDETSYCSSCGKEKPDKKCSKCKQVKYCDRECQRLHWFMHKKNCARPTSNTTVMKSSSIFKEPIDATELQKEFGKITTTS